MKAEAHFREAAIWMAKALPHGSHSKSDEPLRTNVIPFPNMHTQSKRKTEKKGNDY